jgi:hypothetical protein
MQIKSIGIDLGNTTLHLSAGTTITQGTKRWSFPTRRSGPAHRILRRPQGAYSRKVQPVSFPVDMRSLCSQFHLRICSFSPPAGGSEGL